MIPWLIAGALFLALAGLLAVRMWRRATRRARARELAAFVEQAFSPYRDTTLVQIHVPKNPGYADLQIADIEFVRPSTTPRTVYVAGDDMCPHGEWDTADCPHCNREREERENGVERNPDIDRPPAPDLPDDAPTLPDDTEGRGAITELCPEYVAAPEGSGTVTQAQAFARSAERVMTRHAPLFDRLADAPPNHPSHGSE